PQLLPASTDAVLAMCELVSLLESPHVFNLLIEDTDSQLTQATEVYSMTSSGATNGLVVLGDQSVQFMRENVSHSTDVRKLGPQFSMLFGKVVEVLRSTVIHKEFHNSRKTLVHTEYKNNTISPVLNQILYTVTVVLAQSANH
ncbi:hypothetical protein STEG23_013185, partial [Scotinomys teguina]